MNNAPDNKMFAPSYRQRWPQATKAFALEEAAAEAYAAEPTPERLTALRNARTRYAAACRADQHSHMTPIVYEENSAEHEGEGLGCNPPSGSNIER